MHDIVDVNIDLGFNTWLWKERMRLKGIDTPEFRTRDPEERSFGLYAKSVLRVSYQLVLIQVLKQLKTNLVSLEEHLGTLIYMMVKKIEEWV